MNLKELCNEQNIQFMLVAYVDLFGVMRSKLVLGIADGWLSADGAVIYKALDLKVGLFRDTEVLKPAGA